MAAQQQKRVTVYHPSGFPVEVGEKRAEAFKRRGYTVSKPKAKPAAKPAEVDVDALRAEIRAELEAEVAKAAEDTAKATEKK